MKSFHLHLSIFNITNNFKFSKALCASDAEPLCTGQQMYEFSKVKKKECLRNMQALNFNRRGAVESCEEKGVVQPIKMLA